MLLLYFSAWKTLLKWNLVFFFFLLNKIQGTGVEFSLPPNTFVEWPMKNNNIILQNNRCQDYVNPSGQFW